MFYRAEKGDLTDTRMAVVVQEMVPADRSGVMFTVTLVIYADYFGAAARFRTVMRRCRRNASRVPP